MIRYPKSTGTPFFHGDRFAPPCAGRNGYCRTFLGKSPGFLFSRPQKAYALHRLRGRKTGNLSVLPHQLCVLDTPAVFDSPPRMHWMVARRVVKPEKP